MGITVQTEGSTVKRCSCVCLTRLYLQCQSVSSPLTEGLMTVLNTSCPSTRLLLQHFSSESRQIMGGWWRIRVSEAEGKGWSVIMGQREYKYPEQEGETAMCHPPSSRCFSASPPLKIYGGPWGETEECATAHSRAKSTLTASNAKHSHARLSISCFLVYSFMMLSLCLHPFLELISPYDEGQGAYVMTGNEYSSSQEFGHFIFFFNDCLHCRLSLSASILWNNWCTNKMCWITNKFHIIEEPPFIYNI